MQLILIDLINLIVLINILINFAPDSLAPSVKLTYIFTISYGGIALDS